MGMNILIEICCSHLKGHEETLVKDQCRLHIRKYWFSQRRVNEWTRLYTDCVNASSVKMFKNKIDKQLRRVSYI